MLILIEILKLNMSITVNKERPKLKRAWCYWALAATVSFFQACLVAFPSTLTKQIGTQLSLTSTSLGVLFSALFIANMVSQIPGGILLDKVRGKKVLLLALSSMIIGCLLWANSTSLLYWGLLSQIMIGFGAGVTYIAVIYIGRSWLPDHLFPRIIYLTVAVGGLGFIFASRVFAHLSAFQSLRVISFELAIIGIVLLLLILFFLRENKDFFEEKSFGNYREHLIKVLLDKKLWLIGIYAGGVYCQYVVLTSMWRVHYLTVVQNVSIPQAAQFNNMTQFGFLLGCYLCGFMGKYINVKKLMIGCAVAQLVILNIAYLLTPHAYYGVLLFLLGVVSSAVIYSYSLIKDFIPLEQYGVASGILTMLFSSIGVLVSSLVVYLFELIGVQNVMYFMAVLSLSTVVGILALLKYFLCSKSC